MIIKISLFLISAALTFFLSAYFLRPYLTPILSETITQLGLAMLLFGFGIIVLTGLMGGGKQVALSICDYLSNKQRNTRKMLFMHNKQRQIQQLFYFKTLQISYFNELARKRLLSANNHRHINDLAKAIQNDLKSVKAKLPKAAYQQLQKETIFHRNQQNSDELIKLQQKINQLH